MYEQDQDVQQMVQSLRVGEMNRKRLGMCVRIVLYVAFFVGAAFLVKPIPGLGQYWIMVPVLGIVVAKWFLKHPWEEYREAYKKACVGSALGTMFTDLDFDPYDGISDRLISETGLIYMGDSFHVEDCIRGRYNTNYVERSDIRIQGQRRQLEVKKSVIIDRPRVRTYMITIFRGRWLIYDFQKPFLADVQIVQKGFRCTGQQRGMDTSFSRTGMQLEPGNSHFRAFIKHSDGQFAINSTLMAQIQALSDSVRGKLMVGFVGSKLHIVIDDNGRSLEPPLNIFLPLREERVIRQLRGEMEAISQFIDKIRLEDNLFKYKQED